MRAADSSIVKQAEAGAFLARPWPLASVEQAAHLGLLRERRLNGQGVAIAIVDDGIHVESLRAKLHVPGALTQGASPIFDDEHSRVAGLAEPFSRGRRSHGSMCAFDACLAAPGCTLLDLPTHAPRSVGRRRVLDIIAAYRRLVLLLEERVFRHLVVVNAWQALPSDALAGVPTDDARHPLHHAIGELEAAGADVLFAAPDHHARCIHGPALHPSVLTVTATELDGTPFDSSVERRGPEGSGKPDVSNYQGFAGYGLFRGQADYGTSAATALTAGLVAAVRSLPRARPLPPAALRTLFRESARSQGGDPGVVDVRYVLDHL